MIPKQTRMDPPGDDIRWRFVLAAMRRNGYARDALIETLHAVQEAFGYLDAPALRYVAHELRVPLSHVYGVSTFYQLFSLKPAGEHTCIVCLGTACYIKGAPQLLADIEAAYDVRPGETTRDGKLSLLTARCVGSCGVAPVAVFDGAVEGKLSPEEILAHLEKATANAAEVLA